MSGPATKRKRGTYLYAIVAGEEWSACEGKVQPLPQLEGMEGARVYAIVQQQIAAVVSDLRKSKIRPQRRNLATHQQVLQHFTEGHQPILPVSFGVVAENPKTILRLLRKNYQPLSEQLQHVTNKVEMGLRVSWDVPNIFDYFIEHYDELKDLRDRLFQRGRSPSHEEKIEVGQAFGYLLSQARERYTQTVLDLLTPYCSDIRNNPPRHEHEVMNLACLVEEQQQQNFASGVLQAADGFDDNFLFDYNGPWAPYNFVDVQLQP